MPERIPATAAPVLMGVRDFAKVLGVSRDTAYRLVKSGRVHSVKVGNRFLVPRDEAEKFVARETTGADR